MIRFSGVQSPSESSQLFVRTYSNKIGQNNLRTLRINPKVGMVFLAVVGGASLYFSNRSAPPSEYGPPNSPPVDAD
jgi:hypothetical protein